MNSETRDHVLGNIKELRTLYTTVGRYEMKIKELRRAGREETAQQLENTMHCKLNYAKHVEHIIENLIK